MRKTFREMRQDVDLRAAFYRFLQEHDAIAYVTPDGITLEVLSVEGDEFTIASDILLPTEEETEQE